MDDTWWVKQDQLDDDQKKVFALTIDEDHLIEGPPGSGKTNLLLLRAKQLIGSKYPNVAVVVHTRVLQEFIRSGAPKYGVPPSKIVTFRKLAADLLFRNGAGISLPSEFEVSRGILIEALQSQVKAKRLGKEFSCVLVDEAHDFLPEEVAILRLLGKHFFGVADSRQKIYRGQDAISTLESEVETVRLKLHYRNGIKICIVGDGLAKDPQKVPSLVKTSRYKELALPSSVEVIQGTLEEQCKELLVRVETQRKAYPGEWIGIACPRSEDFDQVISFLRRSRISGHLIVQASEEGYLPFEDGKEICALKLHSAKGLEFRAFHILATEGIKKFPMQRELAFMGVTRAKTSLSIYHSSDLPGYLEEALCLLEPRGAVLGLDALFPIKDIPEENI